MQAHINMDESLPKSAVMVLGTADVAHARSKVQKNIAQQQQWLEKHIDKEKKPRTFVVRERLAHFWSAALEKLESAFAPELAAHVHPARLEQCEKKRVARANKKRKVVTSEDEEESPAASSSSVVENKVKEVQQ